MTETILVLNGPNLNLLGTREPEIYGADTLDDIAAQLDRARQGTGLRDRRAPVEPRGASGRLAPGIAGPRRQGDPAQRRRADAHVVALYDAIKAINVPVIEVHLSNPLARESFRHASFVGRAARGTISGFGALSYMLALEAAARL